jgi:hypothetical protein
MQASLYLLLYHGNHLPHNIHLKDFNGQEPKHGLSDGRLHRLECGKPRSHLGVAGSYKPHSLMQEVLQRALIMVKHNSNPLSCRRVSSSTRCPHYPSASSHCRLVATARLTKPGASLRLGPRLGGQLQAHPQAGTSFEPPHQPPHEEKPARQLFPGASSQPGWSGPRS